MTPTRKAAGEPLCEQVKRSVERYFEDLNGQPPPKLYKFVLEQVERPLFQVVMSETSGNVSKAAEILGMNRGTLRARLKTYGIKSSS